MLSKTAACRCKTSLSAKPQDAVASRVEPCRSFPVVISGTQMLATGDLNDQPSPHAYEIDDVGTHGNLATEVVASDLFAAKSHPQIDLSIGHSGAQLAAALKFRAGPETHLF